MTSSTSQQTVTNRDWRITGSFKAFIGVCLFLALFFFITSDIFPAKSSTQTTTPAQSQLSLADLAHSSQPLTLKGSLIANSRQHHLTEFRFVLTPALDTRPLDLNAAPFTIRYQDATQQITDLPWSWRFQSSHNANSLLEAGELVQIIVPVTDALAARLKANTTFALELLSPAQTWFALQRTLPATLEAQMDLN